LFTNARGPGIFVVRSEVFRHMATLAPAAPPPPVSSLTVVPQVATWHAFSMWWPSLHAELGRFARARGAALATEVEDVLQEAALRLLVWLRDRPAGLDQSEVRALAYGITRNLLCDRSRRKRSSVRALQRLACEMPATVASSDPRAELERRRVLTGLLADCVWHSMSTLRPDAAHALLSSDLRGQPQRVVAQLLRVPSSTIKSRVQRARRMLRQLVEKDCAIEFDWSGDPTACVVSCQPRPARPALGHTGR
jgi:RNA polymerase sigma-70 factor, ECF subfamily